MFKFLVFWFNIGESTFDVSVDACERGISAKNLCLAEDSDADEDYKSRNDCLNVKDVNKTRGSEAAGIDWETRSGNFGKQTHPRFEMVPTENRQSRWCVPKKFAEAAFLIGKRAVVLKYLPMRRHWPVILNQTS